MLKTLEIVLFAIIVLLVVSIIYLIYLYFKAKDSNKKIFDLILAEGYKNKVKLFEELNKYVKPNGVVFIGDSITQDYNVYEFYPNLTVYNRGIGGDTTLGLLKRLNCSVFDLNPSKVVLLIGTNDLELLNPTKEELISNIEKIIFEIKSFNEKIEIILLSILPVNKNMSKITVGKRNNEVIKNVNEGLSKLENVKFVNIFKSLEEDGLLKEEYSVEGLHINEKGYEVITKTLEKEL